VKDMQFVEILNYVTAVLFISDDATNVRIELLSRND
jgi:hypothetical protein